jgi:hypothetical protein
MQRRKEMKKLTVIILAIISLTFTAWAVTKTVIILAMISHTFTAWAGTKTGPTTVVGSDVTIFGPQDLTNKDFCLYIQNTGNNALTDLDIQTSPNNKPDSWSSLTFTSCDILKPGKMCTYPLKRNVYVDIRLKASATDTTVNVWLNTRECVSIITGDTSSKGKGEMRYIDGTEIPDKLKIMGKNKP